MKAFVKESIKNLDGYKANDSKFTIKLDANEGKNLFINHQDIMKGLEEVNRYPNNKATLLRAEIAKYLNVKSDNVLAGNGSSETIELLFKTFLEQGDNVLSFEPSFSMYKVFTQIYSGEYYGVPCNPDFTVSIAKLIEEAKRLKPKIILLCNPNNPTGTYIEKEQILRVLTETNAIVVVDEAYGEFAKFSMSEEIDNYQNLVVLRTLSKAFGLASIRVGYMVSNVELISVVDKVRAPYNINEISQAIAICGLQNSHFVYEYVERVIEERERLYVDLLKLNITVYPSAANFLFFHSAIFQLAEKLLEKGILIRKFSGKYDQFYRVTIGTSEENVAFMKAIKEIVLNEKNRNY